MDQTLATASALDLLVGALLVLAVLLKAGFERIGAPSLVAFLLLGLVVGYLDGELGLVSEAGVAVLEFLASLGLIVLLFRVGLDSNLHGLVSKLGAALPIWIGNVVLSGGPGFLAAQWLGYGLIPSLFVGIALTATSLAVSVGVWLETGALRSPTGEILTDVAGLDDLSGIVLMGLLLAVAPTLRVGDGSSLGPILLAEGGGFLLKFGLFVTFCLLVGRYAERSLTRVLGAASSPDISLLITGLGIVVAALAAGTGLSLAIGALLAGLLFSRDPAAVRAESGFMPIYEFFAPFFFIGIGMSVEHAALAGAPAASLVLLVVAVAGKVVGAGLPALPILGLGGAAVIGVSMVPRAEIAMVILQEGRKLGTWAVPDDLFAAMVLVSAVTCLGSPLLIRLLLARYPPEIAATRQGETMLGEPERRGHETGETR